MTCARCGAASFTTGADFMEPQNAAPLCVDCAHDWLCEIADYDGADLRVFVGTSTEAERFAEAAGRAEHDRREARARARIEQAERDAEAQAAKRSGSRPIIGSSGTSDAKKAPEGPGYRERLAREAIERYDGVADRLVVLVREAHPRPVNRKTAAEALGERGPIIGKAMQRAEARGLLARDGKRGYILPKVAA